MSEVKVQGQRSRFKVKVQKTRGQSSEAKGQRSSFKNHRSRFKHKGSSSKVQRFKCHRPGVQTQRSEARGSNARGQRPWVQTAEVRAHISGVHVQTQRAKVKCLKAEAGGKSSEAWVRPGVKVKTQEVKVQRFKGSKVIVKGFKTQRPEVETPGIKVQTQKSQARGHGFKHKYPGVQTPEAISQKPEVSGPEARGSKARGQRFKHKRPEVRGQKSRLKHRRSDARGQRLKSPEVKGSNTRDQTPEVKHQGPETSKDSGQRKEISIQRPGVRTQEVRGQRAEARPEVRDQGSKGQRPEAMKFQILGGSSEPPRRFLRASEATGQISRTGRPQRRRLPPTFSLLALPLSAGCLSDLRFSTLWPSFGLLAAWWWLQWPPPLTLISLSSVYFSMLYLPLNFNLVHFLHQHALACIIYILLSFPRKRFVHLLSQILSFT